MDHACWMICVNGILKLYVLISREHFNILKTFKYNIFSETPSPTVFITLSLLMKHPVHYFPFVCLMSRFLINAIHDGSEWHGFRTTEECVTGAIKSHGTTQCEILYQFNYYFIKKNIFQYLNIFNIFISSSFKNRFLKRLQSSSCFTSWAIRFLGLFV